MDYRDAAFKLFWTMVNAGLAAAIVYVGDLDVAWGAVALAGLQWASSWVREKLGSKPDPITEPFPPEPV
jgi:hypothetical protein